MIQKLTLGTSNIETINIDGVEVRIRPLSAGELSKLQSIEKKGFTMKIGMNNKGKRTSVESNNTDMDINAGEFSQYQSEALFQGVAYGLSIEDEKVTVQDVEQLAAGVPERIFEEIIRISTLTDKDLSIIKSFRKG